MPSCSTCLKPSVYCRGLCRSCYSRLLKNGYPSPKARPSVEDRFWAKVDKATGPDDCWTWTGSKNHRGYGLFSKYGCYSPTAHRTAWMITRGSIPEGLQLDHLCRNKECVNPAHLEPVTGHENMKRAVASRTTCRRGHPFVADNIYMENPRKRVCRTCRDAARVRFHERNPNYYRVGREVVLRKTGTSR